MNTHYTDEKNTQIVLKLLKIHGIRKVIASPGTTNIRLVASMQQDDFFEMYSAADERSAAYMACGMAEETGQPVVITCTGATASRNYVPGLTEAYYRKLPVLAITSTQHMGRVGQNIAQVLDRSEQMKDMVNLSVQLPTCHTEEDIWSCNVQANRAMLELRRNGGGPVHINLETTYSTNFSVEKLPDTRKINRIGYEDSFPEIKKGRIGIFVGAHSKWSTELTDAVDRFCEKYNAVVLCDQTSNYRGEYRVLFSLITSQGQYSAECNNFDLLIHIGNISGSYPNIRSREEWRVNEDGEIRDTFKHLTNVFKMSEKYFFEKYADNEQEATVNTAIVEWKNEYAKVYEQISELPFSNIWIAKNTAGRISENSILHLGILNTLRSWNFFETPDSVSVYCNTGGFGIDGVLSAAVGAALGAPDKIIYCIIGDLAFFYDMNVMGNRHLPSNIRIMLINNGRGTEFRNYNHPGAQFGNDADDYIAAANHYGAKSNVLIKHYAEDLGFKYISASDKQEYLNVIDVFVSDEKYNEPVMFEVFTNWQDESDALEKLNNTIIDTSVVIKQEVKNVVRNIVGQKGINALKKIAGRG